MVGMESVEAPVLARGRDALTWTSHVRASTAATGVCAGEGLRGNGREENQGQHGECSLAARFESTSPCFLRGTDHRRSTIPAGVNIPTEYRVEPPWPRPDISRLRTAITDFPP